MKQYFSESLLAAITEKNQSIQANCKELFLLIEDSVTQTSFVLTNLIDEWISTLTELAQTKPQQIKKMLLDRLEAIIIANRNSLDDICQHSLDIRDGLLSDISPVLELLASIRNNNAVMETSDWIEAQRLIESVAQIKSEIDGLFTCSPDVVVEKSKSVMNWCKFYLKSRKHVGHISLIFIVCLLFWPKFKTLYRWHKMAAKRFMKNCLPSEMGLPHIKEKAMTIRNLTIQT